MKIITQLLFFIVIFLSNSHCFSQKTATDTIYANDTNITYDSTYSDSLNEYEDYTDTASTFSPTFDSINYKDFPILVNNELADTTSKLKRQEDYWYVTSVDKEKKKDFSNSSNQTGWFSNFLSSSAFKFIIWIVIIGLFITILVIYLNENNIGFFTKKSKPNSIEINEEVTDNIFEMNFESAIATAKKENNYHQATRLLFLKLLRNLSQKNIIDYSIEKTNFDYLMALSNTKFYKQFATATRNYEFVWYGEFELNTQQFELIENSFKEAENMISKA